ncbi:MAG: hypothetical protein COZ05_00625 [Armatimonadetes bacterium CG_4_10_14_3_um_filter_59_10]|nr:MAG: hypothetical protein COZ05_00625 [Armatimonadetes bacterium CG_4_10_14_3_um_filter_59_10]
MFFPIPSHTRRTARQHIWAFLVLSVPATMALTTAAPGTHQGAWKSVSRRGECVFLFRNSHSTAMANLVIYDGLGTPAKARSLVALCWMYAQHCECNQPDQPVVWRVSEGLAKLFTARGYPHTAISERCRYSAIPDERADWDAYVAAVARDQPVILTFCYEPSARKLPQRAKRRVSRCFSALGIGYLTVNGQKLLICQDGLSDGQKCEASVDTVSAPSPGIASEGKPWGEPGTSLYKWDGTYSNMVMVFVGRPAK